MIRYEKRVRLLAACLSALAGYVDAVGFIQLGGFFVSFMSGNSTRLGVGIAEDTQPALLAAGLIGTFVTGVALGTFAGRAAGRHRRPVVLLLVAALLALGAWAGMIGLGGLASVGMVLAMGAENAVFEQNGEVRIGLTYMTGTLVKLGQRLADAALGGAPLAWLSYLLLWLGLVAGAVAGALLYPRLGLDALWIAAAAAALLAIAAWWIGPDEGAVKQP